jgi:hypothetical protein
MGEASENKAKNDELKRQRASGMKSSEHTCTDCVFADPVTGYRMFCDRNELTRWEKPEKKTSNMIATEFDSTLAG